MVRGAIGRRGSSGASRRRLVDRRRLAGRAGSTLPRRSDRVICSSSSADSWSSSAVSSPDAAAWSRSCWAAARPAGFRSDQSHGTTSTLVLLHRLSDNVTDVTAWTR